MVDFALLCAIFVSLCFFAFFATVFESFVLFALYVVLPIVPNLASPSLLNFLKCQNLV